MKKAPLLAILALSFAVVGCSNVLTASRDKPIDDNRGTRTLGSTVDDALIETKAAVNIAKASPGLADSHIVVVSYNGVVLIAGQVPRADLKPLAEQAVRSVQRVKTVHDELQVTANSSLLARSNDSWLTTRIKTQMFADEDIPGSRIKVVTENGIVYLLGLVTQQEAAHAVQLIQSVSGVQRIVKLFEYIN